MTPQANTSVNKMSSIGIYSVRSTELDKPPSEREYKQKGLYDVNERTWTDNTDSRIQCLLPDEEGEQYTFEKIQEVIETSTTHVYPECEVPGTVTQPAASVQGFRSASD